MAFSVVFQLLKDKRQAEKFRSALYKLHGQIETLFPELQPEARKVKLESL